MKLLALGLVAVALGTASAAGVGSHGGPPAGSRLATRPCGYLSVGKGWHVRATRNVTCVFARRLVKTFFALHRCLAAQRHPGKACTVSGYRCTETPMPQDTTLVRCAKPGRVVSALSNH
jgi:hypothetical protein